MKHQRQKNNKFSRLKIQKIYPNHVVQSREFSRLEQHSKQLHISRFNLIELIEEVMGMFILRRNKKSAIGIR